MNLSRIKKLPLSTRFSIVALAVLAIGGFLAVWTAQQNQENRTRASGVCAPTSGDLEIDNCNLIGNVGGNLIGNNNTISVNVGGFLIGNSNTIGNNVGKSIIGSNNNVTNNVAKCIVGDNNHVVNTVGGTVTGTGNTARLVGGILPCPPNPFITPTSNPTRIPTRVPSPTRSPGTCADGIDNNQNELIDGGDPICHTDGDQNNPNSYDPTRNEGGVNPTTRPTVTVVPTRGASRCADNIDNDNNGFKDTLDSTCHTDNNPLNPNSYDPTRDGEHGGLNTCADSRDNNSNGVIDGGDPICHTDGNANNPNSYDPNRPEAGGGITPTVGPTSGPTTTIIPTTTVAPGNTSFNITLLLHGIGAGGDSANPQSGGNTNPLHRQRDVKVELYDSQNSLVTTKNGFINFQQGAGNFTGTVDMGSTIATGVYTVKLKSTQFLKSIVPGIQNITAGGAKQLPVTTLVNGDINSDNTLNILDYNILMGCYSDFLPAVSCTPANNLLSDLDDDGAVNQFDYNLFLRELSNRAGQ